MIMIETVFVLSAVMVITAFFKLTGLVFGNSMLLPPVIPFGKGTGPTHYLIFYPSMAFQIWFWAERLGVFVQ